MPNYVKPYIDKIEAFAKKNGKKIEFILIGGLAMSFYGNTRYTLDIDAEVDCDEETYLKLSEYLKKEKIAFNISENISGWGMIPLPQGYRKRSNIVYKNDYLIIKVLDPADFIFSKLSRGTEEDFKDMMEVIKNYNITKKILMDRKKNILFPKDPETFFFQKKFQHLLELISYR